MTKPPSVEGNLTSEPMPRVQLPYQCLETKEGILDMTRGNVHFQQRASGYFAFKRLLQLSDDRSSITAKKTD